MHHIINLSPVPTTETYLYVLKTQKGYYDPVLINKRTEIKTNDPKYNKKFNKAWKEKTKASKSVSPKRSH